MSAQKQPRIFKFVPQAFEAKAADGKDQTPIFSGHLNIRVPTFDERMAMLEDMGVEVDDKGSVKLPDRKPLQMVRRLGQNAASYIQSMDVKRVDGTAEYKTFEDFSYDPDCSSVLIEVSTLLLSGIRPGKN